MLIPDHYHLHSPQGYNPVEHCHTCHCHYKTQQGQNRFCDGEDEYSSSSLFASSEDFSAVPTAFSSSGRSSRLGYPHPYDLAPPYHYGGPYGGSSDGGSSTNDLWSLGSTFTPYSHWYGDSIGDCLDHSHDNVDNVSVTEADNLSKFNTSTSYQAIKYKCKLSINKVKEGIQTAIRTTVFHLKKRPKCAYCGTKKKCTCIEDEEEERRKYEEEEEAEYAHQLEEERQRQQLQQHDGGNKYCMCEKCFKKVNARIVRTSKGGRRKYRRVSARLRGVAGFKISRMAVC
jgi:hypothetical protein